METNFSKSLEIKSSPGKRLCATKTAPKTSRPRSELQIGFFLLGLYICNAAVQLISNALNMESFLFVRG